MATLTGSWSLPITVPLPVVLACGAGAVIVTAAALSGRAARHPDMPAQQWSRPLPAPLARALTAPATRAVLPVLGLIAAAAGGVALVTRAMPVDGAVLLAALTCVALFAGPVYRLLNPVRAFAPAPPSVLTANTEPAVRPDAGPQAPPAHAHGDEADGGHEDSDPGLADDGSAHGHAAEHGHAEGHRPQNRLHPTATAPPAETTGAITAHAAELRLASVWLLALCAILLSTEDPRLLGAAAVAHVSAQAALARWRPGALDPLDVLSDLVARLALVGRDHQGRLAWRNPLVAVAHTAVPRGAVPLGAVVIATSMTHAMAGPDAPRSDGDSGPRSIVALSGAMLDDIAAVTALIATFVVVLVVLRLGVIRPFFASATVPLITAYGIVAAGRWLRPLDLVTFVALHAVAVAVLHRQAIARHDLRTARAVQFPMRVVVLLSVLTGLTLLWAS